MATATTVPLTEYLMQSYRPDREWIDGEIKERALGDRPHATVQKFFMKYFLALEDERNIRVFSELRVQVSSSNFRVPDVLVLRASDPLDDIVHVAPLLCVEVLSPDDRVSEMQERIGDYLAMGVGIVWVVDPRRRTLFIDDGRGMMNVTELHSQNPEVRVAAHQIFAELDQQTAF